jgi:hypothetical protein
MNASQTTVNVRLCSSVGNNSEKIGSASAATASWNHIVITHDGSSGISGTKIYVNGTLDSGASNSGSGFTGFTNTAQLLYIGARLVSSSVTNWFDGKIDEIGIWKGKELSGSEITDLYNGGAGLPYN